MRPSALMCLLLMAVSPFLLAQATAPPAPQPNDLAEISATLKRIENVLEHQADIQKADILLRRVMFAATQLAAAEANLKKVNDEIRSLHIESNDLEGALKRLEETPESQARAEQLLFAKNRIASNQERLTALEQDRVSIENEIQAIRRDTREWQAQLDKVLANR